MSAFEGTFTTPGIGHRHAPIPIAGAGQVTLDDDTLRVDGFEPGGLGMPILIGLATGALGGGAAWLVTHYLFHGQNPATPISVGLIGGLLAASQAPRAPSTRPKSIAIPWRSIAKTTRDPNDVKALMILVTDHRPRGAIHFRAADPVAFETAMLVAINRTR